MDNKRKQLLVNAFAVKKLLKSNAKQQYPRRKTKQTTQIPQTKWYKDIKATDWGMLLTTIVLTWGTLKLYFEAVHQSKFSDEAVKAAKTADSLTKIAIARDSVRYAQSSYDDSVKFWKQYILADSSLNTQINAFKVSRQAANKSDSNASKSLDISEKSLERTQEQFAIENRPYLLPYDLSADTLKPNGKQNISITIKNYGKLPAYIIVQRARLIVDPTISNYTMYVYDQKESRNEYVFLPPGGAYHIGFANTPQPDEYDAIFKGQKSVYVYGELLYEDIVKQKADVASFSFRVAPNGAFIANPTHNGIIELSDSALTAYLTLHPNK